MSSGRAYIELLLENIFRKGLYRTVVGKCLQEGLI
jgi:hypothetical protein